MQKEIPVSIIRIFLAIGFVVSVCSSANVNISGSVTDSAGKGIAGALVLLEKAKISTTTDENGIFTLTGIVGTISQKSPLPMAIGYKPFIENARLKFTLDVESVIDVAIYTMQGRLVSRVTKSAGAGPHALALPVFGDGLYLCRAKIGNTAYLLKGTCLHQPSGGIPGRSKMKSQGTMAKEAKVTAVIDDVLYVSKDGFLDYRMYVSESVMEMPAIRMIVNAGNVTDIDGNVYQSVRIGDQVWTTENLRVTKYNDGSAIPLVTDSATWSHMWDNSLTTPAYCFYNNTTNTDSIKKFGALYNWYVVNTKKLAPKAWHVPSDSEWTIMEKYLVLNGNNWDGTTDTSQYNKIAKSLAAKTDWNTTDSLTGVIGCNLSKNNSSGFSALPGGSRYIDGNFNNQGIFGSWWGATEVTASSAWKCTLSFNDDFLFITDYFKNCGFSVRLLRD